MVLTARLAPCSGTILILTGAGTLIMNGLRLGRRSAAWLPVSAAAVVHVRLGEAGSLNSQKVVAGSIEPLLIFELIQLWPLIHFTRKGQINRFAFNGRLGPSMRP